jgi:hypothetical protein
MSAAWRPRIVVKLRSRRDGARTEPDQYRDNFFDNLPEGEWREQWREFVNRPEFRALSFKSRKMFTSVPPARILELARLAERMDSGYKDPGFLDYHLIDLPPAMPPALIGDLTSGLKRLDQMIEVAYFDPPKRQPAQSYESTSEFKQQDYLFSNAEGGINAYEAWKEYEGKGTDGAGQDFVDLEAGWEKHDDLPSINYSDPLDGKNSSKSSEHGTKVLGIICSRKNSKGCIGIAHGVTSIRLASHHPHDIVANTIISAVDWLQPRYGGVLLLEVETADYKKGSVEIDGGWPIEILEAEFQAIRLATALGIIVVEPAGNKLHNIDLEDKKHFKGNSGAIMVGACEPPDGQEPYILKPDGSGKGPRINCFALGGGAHTTADNNGYGVMDGTSAASAIIAGAAISVQGYIQETYSFRIDGWAMRNILSNEKNGTYVETIGTMPDLMKVIQNLESDLKDEGFLSPTVDLYFQDFEGDKGNPFIKPPDQNNENSPAIILTPKNGDQPVADPVKFSAGTTDTYRISLRIRNRGVNASTAGEKGECHIYLWNKSSEAEADDKWKLLGKVSASDSVPPASKKFVETTSLDWQPGKLAKGTWYLVAVMSETPAENYLPIKFDESDLEAKFKKNEFKYLKELVSRNKKIAWRKITVKKSA